MSFREFAIVDSGVDILPRQYFGPPPTLPDYTELRKAFGRVRLLIIEEKSDGLFLTRYDSGGNFAGDTWHMSVEDAHEQARSEYGISAWRKIPPEVTDVVLFGLSSS